MLMTFVRAVGPWCCHNLAALRGKMVGSTMNLFGFHLPRRTLESRPQCCCDEVGGHLEVSGAGLELVDKGFLGSQVALR